MSDTLRVNLNEFQVVSVWKALKTMIRAKVTESPTEHAFLMETMSAVAPFQKKGYMELDRQKMRACWHAVNVVIQNKMCPDTELGTMCEALSFMAIVLDNPAPMDTPPEAHLRMV